MKQSSLRAYETIQHQTQPMRARGQSVGRPGTTAQLRRAYTTGATNTAINAMRKRLRQLGTDWPTGEYGPTYLRRRPVSGRPAHLGYRALKFSRAGAPESDWSTPAERSLICNRRRR
jgi:hypothetical protein